MKRLLIIFVKNPALGKVKTRLAANVGDERALVIYKRLLDKTHEVTDTDSFQKWVFYSDHLEVDDLWDSGFQKRVQQGNDLGERISNAFQLGFDEGFEQVCIIGSDCYELDLPTLQTAFSELQNHDFVIGPAKDGGYYLLGMNAFYGDLFNNIDWSTNKVLSQTQNSIGSLGKSHFLLSPLSDIDNIEDLLQFPDLNF